MFKRNGMECLVILFSYLSGQACKNKGVVVLFQILLVGKGRGVGIERVLR